MSVPTLRFPEFVDQWEVGTIEQFLARVSNAVEVDPAKQYRQIGVRSHGKGLFHKEPVLGIELGEKRVFWVEPNTLVINIVFAWEQALAITSDKERGFVASHRFPMFEARQGRAHLPFMLHFFLTKQGKNLLSLASPGGAGRNKTLGQNQFQKLKVALPSPAEQARISRFLTAVDTKLELLRKQEEVLRRFKTELMQQLFTQKLRFKRNDGSPFPDWEEVMFEDIFKRVRRKNSENNSNVLTISGRHGLISQGEYFNKSVSANDVTGYYLLHKGDFAYNKSSSIGYPMGAIKRLNRYARGVVSTLYICFSTADETAGAFFEQYFDSGMMNVQLKKLAQEGARNHGLLNLSVVDFFKNIVLPRPHPDEQSKITGALAALDARVQILEAQRLGIEKYKQGLLQQMFV